VLPAGWLLAVPVPVLNAHSPRRYVPVPEGRSTALGSDELAAVMTHERAHLAQRHHVVLSLLEDLRVAVGLCPLVAAAGPAVAALAEMAADDVARRTAGTRAIARALLSLASPLDTSPGVPARALHAAPDGPSWRTRRLAQMPAAAPSSRLALVGAYLVAVLTGACRHLAVRAGARGRVMLTAAAATSRRRLR
jgi:beta-lactamase regulating signal transducer with metallopeptidase domain